MSSEIQGSYTFLIFQAIPPPVCFDTDPSYRTRPNIAGRAPGMSNWGVERGLGVERGRSTQIRYVRRAQKEVIE